MIHPVALTALAIALAAPSITHADTRLQSIVDARLAGDRTGACMAVAVIEKDHVARTFRCADPADAGRIGPDSAFEIGSVSKTMTAALLADLIAQGKGSLDDRLADWLPDGTQVPAYQGQPILLRHVVMHTSGLPALPSRLGTTDHDDPYANLTAEALLASLADVELTAAPGSQFEYSNFASMLLSYAVARRIALATPPVPGDIAALETGLQPPQERAIRWISASAGDSVRMIGIDEVLYFQARDKCVSVVLEDGEATIRMSIRDLLAGLDPDAFWQVHRGTVVRVAAIDRVQKDELGKRGIVLRGSGQWLPVSAAFVHRFRGM